MKIEDFIEARIAEDEQIARDADSTRWLPEDKGISFEAYDAASGYSGRVEAGTTANMCHIARHDPARVLRQCAAIRAILETQKAYAKVQAPDEPLSWGVVANVREPGSKHFRPGQKLWVNWVTQGDGGERLNAVASHRGPGQRLIKIVVASKMLESFRVKGIYSPQIHGTDIGYCSREDADELVAHMQKWATPFYVLERNPPFGERILGTCPTLDAALEYAHSHGQPGQFRITQAPRMFGREGEMIVVDYAEDPRRS